MGDIADLALEHLCDPVCDEDDWVGCGYSLPVPDGFDNVMLDETSGALIGPRSDKRSITCRACKTPGLQWRNRYGKWYLYDGDAFHQCPVHPIPDPG